MAKSSGCVHSGLLFCYDGCDFENIVCGCVGSHDCLCIRYSDCCAIGVPVRGCGIVTKEDRGEIVKLGCLCVECGIIRPTSICAGARKHCCCFVVGSIPCSEEYVPKPTLGYFCIQCFPEFGCCLPPPQCKALDDLSGIESPSSANLMDR